MKNPDPDDQSQVKRDLEPGKAARERFFKNPETALALALAAFILLLTAVSEIFAGKNPVVESVMRWLSLAFYLGLLIFLVIQVIQRAKGQGRHQARPLLITLLIFSLLWAILSITRIGLYPDSRYWNTAGVPVIATALAAILLGVIILDRVGSKLASRYQVLNKPSARLLIELGVILGIWLLASLIWIKTPFSNSFFFYGPFPPAGNFQPASDARLMDLGGQYLIIGSRLETPYFTEKPYYALFLGLIRFAFGQDYVVATNVQMLFFALFPVILYLLGKAFASKGFGIALAAFAIFKEFTAILFTYKISVSNSRLMMTEFPSALLLTLAALLLFRWLSRGRGSLALPLAAGAVLGVASLVRSNNLVVLGLVFVYLVLISLRRFKPNLAGLGLFALGALITIMPWLVYNQVTYGRDPLTWKVQAAIEQRFAPAKTPLPETAAPSPTLMPTQAALKEETAAEPTVQSVPTPKPTSPEPAPEPTPQALYPANLTPYGEYVHPQIGEDTVFVLPPTPPIYENKLTLILGHFFNNQVKALFVLPFQIFPQKPTLILDQVYWQEPVTWQGSLPPAQAIAFGANLILIAFGIAAAWQRFYWAGLLPLVFNIAYYLANALVRTSGSRYLLPVDWTIYFYFLLGIFTVLAGLKLRAFIPTVSGLTANMAEETKNPKSRQALVLTILAALIVGLSLPGLNLAFPTQYHAEAKEAIFERLPFEKIEKEIGIKAEGLRAFYERPDTVLVYGKAIYSAYAQIEDDPVIIGDIFTVLTPAQVEVFVSDGVEPAEPLPEGEDMVFVGCKRPETNYVDAYLGYFVQSDRLIWSSIYAFNQFCP